MAKKKSKKSIKESIPFFTKPFKGKNKGKNGLRKKDSIFKKVDQKEEDIIAGAFKNKLSKTKAKPEKEKVVIESAKPKGKKKRDYTTIIIVSILLLLLLFFLIYLLYPYLTKPQDRYLEAGENVETAVVKTDSSLDINLKEFNPEDVLSVKFVLSGDGEYDYETSYIKQEYSLYPSDFGLSNFDPVGKASVVFRYKTEPVPPGGGTTPPPTQTVPNCTDKIKNGDETGIDCGGSCKACTTPGGGGSPGGGTTPCTAKTCAEGKCGKFSDGCGGTITCGCNDRFYCYAGEGVSNVCVNSSSSCVDSDNGKDYYTKGNVTVNNSGVIAFKEDICSGNLTEFFCYYNGSVFEARNESYTCPYRCLSTGGACERLLCEVDNNCTTLNILKVESCTNNPDNNPFTFDNRTAFTSKCVSKECTYGDTTVKSSCIKNNCNAECSYGETFNSTNFYCQNNDLYNYYYECNSTCGFANLSAANDELRDNCERNCKPNGCNSITKKYETFNISYHSCKNNKCVEPVFCDTPISAVCKISCGATCEEGSCKGEQVCDTQTCICTGKECTKHSSCDAGEYCDSAGVCQDKLSEGAECSQAAHPVYPKQPTNAVCSSGYCRSDYDGGEFCVPDAFSCTHGDEVGVTYANNALAPDCISAPLKERKCMNGAWGEGNSCDDLVRCTDDSCNGVAGCQHTPNNGNCDDTNWCNGFETCDIHLGCRLGTNPCPADTILCSIESCDEAKDVCQQTLDHSSCADMFDCTDDSCSVTEGCQHFSDDSKCASWESCTVLSGCVQSSCSGCTNCNVWNITSEPCDYDKCHNDCNKTESCYFSGSIMQPCITNASACTSITSCADYPIAECENDPCGKSASKCIWDENSNTCMVKPVCGNDVLEYKEDCDKAKLGGKTCANFFAHVYTGSSLGCCSPDNCTQFNLSSCRNMTYTRCEDTDGGIDYYKRGYIGASFSWKYGPDCNGNIRSGSGSGQETGSRDYCINDNNLREYYCDTDNSIHYEDHYCGAGRNTCIRNLGVCAGTAGSLSWWEGIKQFFANLF